MCDEETSTDQHARVRRRALLLLARREHSRFELRRKLQEKGFDLAEINSVINDLAEAGLQSDERFTEAYVKMRIDRGYGPLRIQAELHERGVASELIERFVVNDADFWQGFVQKVRLKKFGAKMPNDFAEQAKQMRYLQYKGFDFAQIQKAFSRK